MCASRGSKLEPKLEPKCRSKTLLIGGSIGPSAAWAKGWCWTWPCPNEWVTGFGHHLNQSVMKLDWHGRELWWRLQSPCMNLQGWGQVKYLYLVLGTWCKILSTWYLLVLDTLKFKSTWYLRVLEGKVLDTCPSTFKYFCKIKMYIQT